MYFSPSPYVYTYIYICNVYFSESTIHNHFLEARNSIILLLI